ncbi:MAG: hypothetical protein K8S98_08165 [Planctomycetes bacterium]|nr:hypothetical protein [Planctomycetota bacterium]
MSPRRRLALRNAALATFGALSFYACAPTADASEGVNGESAAPSADRGPASTLAKRGTHASGITYRYPRDWELQARGGGVLVPNDAPRDEQGASERYLVLGFPCADAASDLVLALFGAESPFELEGAPERLGSAQRFRYRASDPRGELVADAYVAIDDGVAHCLVGSGPRAALEARAPLARAVFESFECSAPERDPRVVGSWFHGRSYASERRMTFEADGTFVESSPSDGSTKTGTWYAADDDLTLVPLDGASRTLTYQFVDDALVTLDANGARTLWE